MRKLIAFLLVLTATVLLLISGITTVIRAGEKYRTDIPVELVPAYQVIKMDGALPNMIRECESFGGELIFSFGEYLCEIEL